MKCKNCKKYEDCKSGSGLTWPCGAYAPNFVTNAEKIKIMNREELLDFIKTDEVQRLNKKNYKSTEDWINDVEAFLNSTVEGK